jgi:hypothetical protein
VLKSATLMVAAVALLAISSMPVKDHNIRSIAFVTNGIPIVGWVKLDAMPGHISLPVHKLEPAKTHYSVSSRTSRNCQIKKLAHN